MPTATRSDAANPIALGGFAHVEFWVGNAYQAAQYFRSLYGFRISGYQGPETGVRDRVSYVLDQNDARFIVTSSLRANSEIARHVYEHGDGVKDIAFRVAEFPDEYYEGLPERAGLDGLDYASIQRERLLVDQDAHGYLVQTFTRVIQDRPTLFLEFIERKGALGFGEGNAKDLFLAIERDQEKRGNL